MVAKPRESAALIRTLRSLMLLAQAAPGLLASRLFVDADNPNAICYVEEWQAADDLDQQIRSSHYAQLLSVMEQAAEPPEFRVNWVSAVRGLEYLAAAKRPEH